MTAPVLAPLVRGVLLLVAVLLPAALPGWVPAAPDLVVLVVVAAGLAGGPVTGALVGVAGGWLLDLVPPGAAPLGAGALLHLAVGGLAGTARRLVPWSAAVPVLVVLLAETGVQAVRLVLAAAGTGAARPGEALGTIAVTALAGVLFLPPLLALERRLAGPRGLPVSRPRRRSAR